MTLTTASAPLASPLTGGQSEPAARTAAPSMLAAATGFWGAVLSAGFALLFAAGAVLAGLRYPDRAWQGLEHWAATYAPGAMYLTVLPSLFLTWAFVALMASVHALVPEERKVLGLLGLSLAVLYAAILDANYFLQLTFVRQQVLGGHAQAVGLLAMEDPQSAFWAIEFLGYGLMGLATLAVAPLFAGWTRRMLLLNGATGVLSLASPVLDLPFVAVIVGAAAWQVALPAAAILLARRFRHRAGRADQPLARVPGEAPA